MPEVAVLVSDLYDFVDKNRRNLTKVSQDVIGRIECLKKAFDLNAEKYREAENMLSELETILEIPPSALVFIGLDFKKYEEIINYIQTWSSLLKEPERRESDSKYRLEMKILDLETDLHEYESKPDKFEDTKYLGFSSEASQEHVFEYCQEVLDSAVDQIKDKVDKFVNYIVRNRLGRLESDYQRYQRICETLQAEYEHPKETVISEEEYLSSRAPWDTKCQTIQDRIQELENEQQTNQLSSEDGESSRS